MDEQEIKNNRTLSRILGRWTISPMTKAKSRYWRDWRQSASGLACILAPTGPRACIIWLYEIVDNSIDEALAGFCTHIEVEILPGDVITVRDNGRGIPVGIQEKWGCPP